MQKKLLMFFLIILVALLAVPSISVEVNGTFKFTNVDISNGQMIVSWERNSVSRQYDILVWLENEAGDQELAGIITNGTEYSGGNVFGTDKFNISHLSPGSYNLEPELATTDISITIEKWALPVVIPFTDLTNVEYTSSLKANNSTEESDLPPVVKVYAATYITETSAHFTGYLDKNEGIPISLQGFEFRQAGGTWQIVHSVAPANVNDRDIKYTKTGLLAGYNYEYRAFASNVLGERSVSSTMPFKTLHIEVRYDANGGTGAPATQLKTHGVDLRISSTIPTRSGYTFISWNTEANLSGPNLLPGDYYIDNKSITLHAYWLKANVYDITYHANGGSNPPAAQQKTHGVDIKLRSETPTRIDYSFSKWNTDRNGAGIDYNPGAFYTANAHVTLYAMWKLNPTYYVSYHANGGSGAPATQPKIHGSDLTLSSIIPTRADCIFIEWNTNINGTGISYKAGGIYKDNAGVTLYAMWIPNTTYTVTYNANGGTGAPANQQKLPNVSLTLHTTKPTRTGHTFLRWNTSINGTGTNYNPGTIYTANAPLTLYAVWQADTYIITYNANGGTGAPANQTKTFGVDLKLSATTPTRTGYTFDYWSSSAGGTYQPGATYSANTGATMTAVWKQVSTTTYTVTYNANGGSGAPANQTKTHDVSLILSATKPTRTGYTFDYWSSSTGGTYQPGGTYSVNANATMTAIWKVATYIVTYDAQGGTGAPPNQTKIHNVDLTLHTTKPTRTGYTFDRWYSSSLGIFYNSGATYTINADMALFAVWNANTYTVTYNLDGGSGSFPNQTKVYNTNLQLHTTKPTRTGYEFVNWTSNTGVKYNPGDFYSLNANATMTAVWQAVASYISYKVTYNANGGSNAPAEQIKLHNVPLTLRPEIPTRPSHTFRNWAASTGGAYFPGGTYIVNAHTTMDAIWKPDTYEIAYNLNGGSGSLLTQIKVHNIDIKLHTTVPTRTGGYIFDYWSSNTGGKYYPGDFYTANASTTMTAMWKLATYTVTYNLNGGSGSFPTQTKTYGASLTLHNTKPTRTGYNFVIWTSNRGNYIPGAVYSINDNLSLHAVWEVAVNTTYKVTYNPNGGSYAPADQIKVHNAPLTLSYQIPTRSGFAFTNWEDTTGKVYNPGTVYSTNAPLTLYAMWRLIPNTYTISYKSVSGSSNIPPNQTKMHDIDIKLSTTIPTRTGYTFMNWYHSIYDLVYYPGDTCKVNINLTLEAMWKVHTYTVTYNPNGGVGSFSTQTKTYGVDLKLHTTMPTRNYHDFVIWETSTGVRYKPGETYTLNANLYLYAIWEPYYYVTYNLEGGTCIYNLYVQFTKSGVGLKIHDAIPTREGHTFIAWHHRALDKYHQPGSIITTDKNVSLFAVWLPATTYTVSYNANGGTDAPASQYKVANVKMQLSLKQPVREGYRFVRWYSKTGERFSPGDYYFYNESTTLTAEWIKN